MHAHAHAHTCQNPTSVVSCPFLNWKWKTLPKMWEVSSRLGETNKMSASQTALGSAAQSVAPHFSFLFIYLFFSQTAVLPTCSVPKTTRGVWLHGPSATTVMGSNTIGADRNMRAEEADSYVICLETGAPLRIGRRRSPGLLWQHASF